MIDRLTLENYRNFANTTVEFGPINVLFGPNGAGKTNLLGALRFLSDSVREGLGRSIDAYGGAPSLRRWGASPGSVTQILADSGRYTYSRSIPWQPAGRSTFGEEKLTRRIDDENLRVLFSSSGNSEIGDAWRSKEVSLRWPSERSLWETFISTWDQGVGGARYVAPDDPHEPAAQARILYGELKGSRYYLCRDLDIRALGDRGSRSQEGLALGVKGALLWNVLRNLRDHKTHENLYGRIVYYLQKAFPWFEDFELVTFAQFVACQVIERGGGDPYPISLAPDGLTHLTFCLVSLFADGLYPAIVSLDEPDISLHPWAISTFCDAVREVSSTGYRQVFLTSHSPTLLSNFPESNLYLCASSTDGTQVQRVSDVKDNRDLLDQFSIGTLYEMNIVGPQSSEPLAEITDSNDE